MDIKHRLKRSFKLRFAIIYPLGAYVIFFAIPDDKSLLIGIWFIIPGLLIRLWSNGYIMKSQKLTTCGPYRFVRHPLYLGTTLLIIGFIIMLRVYAIGILSIVIISIIYCKTIRKEEKMLGDKFKKEWFNYQKKVRAIIPMLHPYQGADKWPFSFKRLVKSQEYKLLIWTIILVINFHLKDEFMVGHETMDAKTIGLIIISFILGISDLVGEFIKWARRRAKNAVANYNNL